MPSVNLQGNPVGLGNPYIADVGENSSNAVIISSDQAAGAIVAYQIRRRDRTAFNGTTGGTVLTIDSSTSTSQLVLAVSTATLTIVLPFRTDFEVRTNRAGGAWTSWVSFKTRDKTYALPDADTELRTTSAATTQGETVTVTNLGKATVQNTSAGATVTNSDQQDNDSISNNFATGGGNAAQPGRTIRTKTIVQATSTGARVTTQN